MNEINVWPLSYQLFNLGKMLSSSCKACQISILKKKQMHFYLIWTLQWVEREKKNVLVLFKMWRLKEAKSQKVFSFSSYPQKWTKSTSIVPSTFWHGTFSLKIERKWKYPLKFSLLYAVKVLPEEWTCVVHDVHCCKIGNKKKMLKKKGLPDHQNAYQMCLALVTISSNEYCMWEMT